MDDQSRGKGQTLVFAPQTVSVQSFRDTFFCLNWNTEIKALGSQHCFWSSIIHQIRQYCAQWFKAQVSCQSKCASFSESDSKAWLRNLVIYRMILLYLHERSAMLLNLWIWDYESTWCFKSTKCKKKSFKNTFEVFLAQGENKPKRTSIKQRTLHCICGKKVFQLYKMCSALKKTG